MCLCVSVFLYVHPKKQLSNCSYTKNVENQCHKHHLTKLQTKIKTELLRGLEENGGGWADQETPTTTTKKKRGGGRGL